MKLKVYTVMDSAVQAYLPPFTARAPGEALRMFEQSVQTPNHQFNRYAADYTLFEVGEFDDATGQIAMHSVMKNMGNGAQFKTAYVESSPGHFEKDVNNG